jgi:hypothetical protein
MLGHSCKYVQGSSQPVQTVLICPRRRSFDENVVWNENCTSFIKELKDEAMLVIEDESRTFYP